MPDTDRSRRRARAREYFDTHSIEDEPSEEVNVEVKPALSAMISLRLDQEHYKKLRALARAQNIGPTTLARMILQQALGGSGPQPLAGALKSAGARTDLARVVAESKSAVGYGEPEFLVITAAELDRLNELALESARELLQKAIRSTAATVTPGHGDLHEKLRGLGAGRRS